MGRFLLFCFALFPAGIWELHVLAFLPWWLQAAPLWPWFVVVVCLEVDLRRVSGLWLGLMTWMALLPVGTVGYLSLLSLTLFGVYGLLRVWLSYRSIWSALALVWMGRLVFFLGDLGSYWWEGRWGELNGALFSQMYVTRFVWDAMLVIVGMRCALWARKRLQPYVMAPNRFV